MKRWQIGNDLYVSHHPPARSRVSQAFPRTATSAAAARRFVRGVLSSYPGEVDTDTAVLLANELVTNAIRHTGVDRVEVSVAMSPSGVRIGVADDEPAGPVVNAPSPDDPSGRGMAMVADLAERWGVYRGSGERKWIWFRLGVRPAAG